MSRKTENRQKRNTGFLTLSRQFRIIVILGIIVSCITVLVFLGITGPIMERMNPPYKIKAALSEIGRELYRTSENLSLTAAETIPEIDTVASKYPQYDFTYEVYPGIDRETFDLEGILYESKVYDNSYAAISLDAANGIIVVGVSIPEIGYISNILSIAIILLFLFVLLLFIGIFAGRKVKYLKNITKNLEYMAGGDLNSKIPIKGRDEISQVARHINEMTSALQKEFQKEKEIEDSKKQLVTNISHDLRTPLTAILGFLGILEGMDLEKESVKAKQYIHCAYQKSDGLAHLVDQLFDYILVSNRQLPLTVIQIEPAIYFMQLFSEYENLLDTKEIDLVYFLKNSDRPILLDCKQFKRVIENLIQNIQKYGKNKSEVIVDGVQQDDKYILTITNESAILLEESNDFLGRHFTTDLTSGKSSGLGLAICKELVEQQQGEFMIKADGYIFKTVITLNCCESIKTITSE